MEKLKVRTYTDLEMAVHFEKKARLAEAENKKLKRVAADIRYNLINANSSISRGLNLKASSEKLKESIELIEFYFGKGGTNDN